MRQITINDKEYQIMGTAFTSYLYKKDFKQSLTSDVLEFSTMQENGVGVDDVNLLQITYALIKTAKRDVEPFETWLESLGQINLQDFVAEVIEEAGDATFHETKKAN